MAIVTLTTDFGTTDPFVGIMKGVLAGRAPGVQVIDVSHGIPAQHVLAGALVLRAAVPYFPPGTVHVGVVDPGVGGTRKALCIETATSLLVGPDNGVLSLAAPADAVRRIVHLTEERFFLTPVSATFHGRDVFAPVAAALATGTPPTALGPETSTMERLAVPPVADDGRVLRGQVIYVDHFGNLTTNLTATALEGLRDPAPSITIRQRCLRGVAPTYATAARGELVAVVNSWGLLEIAVREGSAREALEAGEGEPVLVEGAK
jgi:hypothetical protein